MHPDRPKKRALSCSIEDDGRGFDVQAIRSDCQRRGLGLTGMQERLHAIGGALLIDSAPGRGTKLLIQLSTEISNGNSHRAR
jgi:two-component system, NarL family, sensor histidine kinase DegS